MISGRLWKRLAWLALAAVIWTAVSAGAETARDVTMQCGLTAGASGKNLQQCVDRNYETYWRSANGDKAWIEVEMPEGETASGVEVQWHEHPHAWGIQQLTEAGTWEDLVHSDSQYLTDYLALPEGIRRFRVANAPGEKRHFNLTELRVYGAGERPAEVQQWNPPAEKADLMLLAAHPDDEILWFGGTLPTYAGEKKKVCQVCMMVPSRGCRRLELLDCLWTCGVKNYPVWGRFADAYTGSLKQQYTRWNKERVYDLVIEWIRRFKPEVLLTHDVNGEYGHGGHRACADAAMEGVRLAANKKKYPRSAREFGTWDVPKCYLHLYGENRAEMDWRQPLEAFGGRTSFDVAEEAFRCHVSQQKTSYRVMDWGECSCSLFGLYRSLVGPDTAGGDFFENLE